MLPVETKQYGGKTLTYWDLGGSVYRGGIMQQEKEKRYFVKYVEQTIGKNKT